MPFSIKLDQIIVFFLYLLAVSPIFYSFEAIQTLLMIVTSFLLLINTISKRVQFKIEYIPFLVCFIILLLLNLFYTNVKSLKNIADSFFIFIVPLLSLNLYGSPFFLSHKDKIIKTFILSCFSLSVFFIGFYLVDIPNHNFDWYLLRFRLEHFFTIHGTYISLWLGLSLILLFDYIVKNKIKFVYIFFFIVIGMCLFLYNSRVVIFGIIIISFLRLLSIKDKKKIIGSVIILIAFSSFVLLFSGRIYDNFNDLLNESIYTSERYTIAYCSCETASKSLLLGYDLNKIQVLLNGCYDRYYYPNLTELNFNSHCQYLDFTLKGGLLLSLSFVATLFIKLKKAIKTKNILYLSITLLFSLAFLTENVLLRQYGIFAYAFFEILFLGSLFRDEGHSTNKIKEY